PDENSNRPFGVCIAPTRFRSGIITVKTTLHDLQDFAARVVVGYNAALGSYYSVGLGGYGFAYIIDVFSPASGWSALRRRGAISQLRVKKEYLLKVTVKGQRIALAVDDVEVLEERLPAPLPGDQIGLFGWGEKPVTFKNFDLDGNKPNV